MKKRFFKKTLFVGIPLVIVVAFRFSDFYPLSYCLLFNGRDDSESCSIDSDFTKDLGLPERVQAFLGLSESIKAFEHRHGYEGAQILWYKCQSTRPEYEPPPFAPEYSSWYNPTIFTCRKNLLN